MLIRSQDKKSLVNIANTVNITVQEDNELVALYEFEHGCDVLGKYSSGTKAIKVLDMIQAAYESSLYCDHAFDNAAQVQRPYIFVNNIVFQMPQDSEVEI